MVEHGNTPHIPEDGIKRSGTLLEVAKAYKRRLPEVIDGAMELGMIPGYDMSVIGYVHGYIEPDRMPTLYGVPGVVRVRKEKTFPQTPAPQNILTIANLSRKNRT